MNVPHFRTLEPGMIADFVVRDVEACYEDLPDMFDRIEWYCNAYLNHPYFIIGINPSDWMCHLQVSNRADYAVLRFGCKLERTIPPKYLLETQQEEREIFETLPVSYHQAVLLQLPHDSPSRKAAWKPIPCMRCNAIAYYDNDTYENWEATGRLVNGDIRQHKDHMGHHEKLNWRI